MHLQAPQKTEKGSFALLGGMAQILKWENYCEMLPELAERGSAVEFVFSREGGGKIAFGCVWGGGWVNYYGIGHI
jgi:hypothetical protein